AGPDDFGPLLPANAHGLMLPAGFSSRIVAVTGQLVAGTSHVWHGLPDGGAVFAAPDGGWVYVSNCENASSTGGVGALRFAADGALTSAYSILGGTNRNCAGGATPWGSWLSCEEVVGGRVYECDPFAPGSQGVLRAGLGTFSHEAAAVDDVRQTVYLTEDQPSGRLYRLTPASYPDLSSGVLEVAQVLDPNGQGAIQPGQVRPLAWHALVEPNPAGGGVQNATFLPVSGRATRFQVAASTAFNGGEGCFYHDGSVYFATKGDNRVWRIDAAAQTIEIVYDLATSAVKELSGVDNVMVSSRGDVYVAEDGGNMQIVALTASGGVVAVVQVTGQSGSEIAGPALTPDGQRLYFSSQRLPGTTYEISGPFSPPQLVPFSSPLSGSLFAGSLGLAALLAL
ncbi:MAG TPA: alkaline phosphatase PhoX, partial [Planctomycetota bacterium]|nr:alkaline phosphatase PhoX [Planctomycetota bacterium]